MTDLPKPDPEVVRKFRERYKPIRSELWLTIPDFPNYQLSEDGRVRNIDNGRELPTSDGVRSVVQLQKGGKHYRRSVRKLYRAVYGQELGE